MILPLLFRRYLKRRTMTWLEITPPAQTTNNPQATEQLFSVIHGLYTSRSAKDKLLNRLPVMSFEITSTRKEGIRYLIQVEHSSADLLTKAIAAYLPEAKVRETVMPHKSSDQVLEFTTKNHYIFPLTLPKNSDQHDPLGYLMSAMTKLNDDEQLTIQLVVSPLRLRGTSVLARKILSNEDLLAVPSGPLPWLPKLLKAMNTVLWGVVDLITETSHGATTGGSRAAEQNRLQQLQVAKRQRPARTLSSFELELMQSMHAKVTQPLFQVNLRVLSTGPRASEHLRTIRSAVDGFSVPLYQALVAKRQFPLMTKHTKQLAEGRLPALFRRRSLILSTSEVASLYHFPSRRISRTDNLMTSLSKTLPAPISLKTGEPLAVYLGENHHHGIVTPVGLTEAERERHVYIIGGTGNGKTTLLQYAVVQDIRNGKGLAVIDPHGDLAETLLRYIPKERIDDVIYLNPDDLSHPIGINLLELPDGLSGDDLLREKDVITESVISVMRKLFSDDDSGGHRVEYVLRNTIQTALTLEHATLFTIYDLLNDPKFRRSVVRTLQDENLKNFWKNELGKAGGYQQVKMVAGITAKIGRFLFSASAKRMLEQEKSTIDFDAILDGKILICNFSKGILGEDTSTLFGTTVLTKLQLASLRRARTDPSSRQPFYLYVDEFQNFATIGFVQMLSEARKYKLFLTMAEQSTAQQEEQRLVDVILANVGTVICFRSGSPADERLVLPLFSPYIAPGEIANLPAYSFYARLAATHSQEPMSGITVVLSDEGNRQVAERVVKHSRQMHAIKASQSETISPINKIPASQVLLPQKNDTPIPTDTSGLEGLHEIS